MTRTFVAGGGEPTTSSRVLALTRESLDRVYPEVRAGADGRAIFARSCEPFIAAGQPTQLTKAAGEVLATATSTGSATASGSRSTSARARPRARHAAAGDVDHARARLLPARATAACRLEDLVVVTEDGCETLTDFPYDL